ncbi:MAG: DNA polymerase III subunit delta' [Luteimonas sp.]|nr:DNA polymerase III subunit delta' [Luteimonas sp.]
MSEAAPALAPWQRRVHDHAAAALDAGRLGHAQLFCGPAHMGKHAVALQLARRLMCTQRTIAGMPCGACRGCQLMEAGTHPDFMDISFIPTKDGSKLRTEIVIEQIRALSEQLTLTPQFGGAQVAIIDPADAINHAASNALLKTLEEPVPGRHLWLVSAHPERLSATIRSRCQRLDFRLPPRVEARSWLQAQGHPQKAADEALDAARGHPGLADAWLSDGGIALRREVAADLGKLARGELGAVEAAQRWTAAGDAALRLRHAADLALAEATSLTTPARMRKLAAWFDAANRTRELLQTTVRADLAVTELLLAWRGNEGGANAQARGRA